MRREMLICSFVAMVFLPWMLMATPQEAELATSNSAPREHRLQEITRKLIEVSADKRLQNRCIELRVRKEGRSSPFADVAVEATTPIQLENSRVALTCHSIIVTEFLLSFSDDDDLTAIVAHELGHVAHGDTRLGWKRIVSRTFVRILSLNTIRQNEDYDQRRATEYAVALLERYGADPWTLVYAIEKTGRAYSAWVSENLSPEYSLELKDDSLVLQLKKFLRERRSNLLEQK